MFYNFFYKFSCKFFFIYIKVSKYLSAKYYEENKERLQKQACERYQNLSKDEKSYNTVVIVAKVSQKMKNKSLLKTENILWREKMIYYNYKKVF